MKLKKWNAALGLLSILLLLIHVGYSVFAYLTLYYNPGLTKWMAVPFMVVSCLHAVLGMIIVFTQADGTRMDLYPRQNLRTVLQRVSAALIFPLLILHLNTFDFLKELSGAGQWFAFWAVTLGQVSFYAVVLTHVAVSLSRALISLGWLSSREAGRRLDLAVYIAGAVAFVLAVYAVISGQVAMFVH